MDFYDTDGDGKVHVDEYFALPKSNQRYWDSVDLNKDGCVPLPAALLYSCCCRAQAAAASTAGPRRRRSSHLFIGSLTGVGRCCAATPTRLRCGSTGTGRTRTVSTPTSNTTMPTLTVPSTSTSSMPSTATFKSESSRRRHVCKSVGAGAA